MDIGKNITPALLNAIHAKKLVWHEALGELCDNSLDAGATRVEIRFEKKKTLIVRDDGSGCRDIERMLTLGDHFKHSTTQLGRYGVGLKEAACWLWGELKIDTHFNGVRRTARVNWPHLAKQTNWELPDPVERPTDLHGTTLVFRNYTRTAPDYAALAGEIGYRFTPAIQSGKQIVIEGQRKTAIVCTPWRMPDLEQIVQDTFSVNGKRVKLNAGIVKEGQRNVKPGFSFAHRHRIITNSALGDGGLGVQRICGLVELDGRWKLGTNKTEIVDECQDELAEAIYVRCESILKSAAQQAQVLRNSELEAAVTEELQMLLSNTANSKARRNASENTVGGKKPTGNGAKHKRAAKTQPGERFIARCRVGMIRMEWQERDDDLLGSVDLPGNVIYMNSSHPRLQKHRQSENTAAIVDNAMHLLAFVAIEDEQSNRFEFARNHEGFIAAVSSVLSAQQHADEATKLQLVS